MNRVLITVVFLVGALLAVTNGLPTNSVQSGGFHPPQDFPDFSERNSITSTGDQGFNLVPSIVSALIQSPVFQAKLRGLYRLLEFGFKFFDLLRSFATRENFFQVRRFLKYIAKVCEFLIGYLPGTPEGPGLLEGIFLETEQENNPQYAVVTPNTPQNDWELPQEIAELPQKSFPQELPKVITKRNVPDLTEEEKNSLAKRRDDVRNLIKLLNA